MRLAAFENSADRLKAVLQTFRYPGRQLLVVPASTGSLPGESHTSSAVQMVLIKILQGIFSGRCDSGFDGRSAGNALFAGALPGYGKVGVFDSWEHNAEGCALSLFAVYNKVALMTLDDSLQHGQA